MSNYIISKINTLVNKAIKEIKIANARVESLEKMIEEYKILEESKISKAYSDGYKRGYLDASNNGSAKEENDEVKLVLNNN